MSKEWCAASPQGVRITVQITPNAKKSEILGVHDDALKIRLQAPPIEGRANEALVRFIAETLKIPKQCVVLTHGHTSKRKMLEIRGNHLDPEAARTALLP